MISSDIHTHPSDPLLAELAALYGLLPRYCDSRGVWRECSLQSIYQVLAALGAKIDAERVAGPAGRRGTNDLERAVEFRKEALWRRMLEPVLVFWDGQPRRTLLRLPSGESTDVELTLVLEDGTEKTWRVGPGLLRLAGQERVADRDYAAWWLPPRAMLPTSGGLPLGYHRLRARCGAREAEATVICAPPLCWSAGSAGDASTPRERPWGVFAPLYAVRSERDWGAGDLSDLANLGSSVAEAGGSAVATLPLLAAFLDTPFEPAPYRPVSRLFWNEFYLAPEETEEWSECPSAREDWQSAAVRGSVAALRSAETVDYKAVMALKRNILERLSGCFFERAGEARRRDFSTYLDTHPLAFEYARFRSELATERSVSHDKYHLYCQWQMNEQLARCAGTHGGAHPASQAGLFLDVPIGVHPHGFDTWRWRDAFVQSMSIGAPPDALFALGQNWDTPPLHPERMREQGHQYLVAYLREQMRYASYLRIDHFMGLHRLFCIPEGNEATDGAYVTYPAEEQYAVLALESHRHQTVVVGEDLGTVPPEVRRHMRRHGVLGTWVLQLAARPGSAAPLEAPPSSVIAAVNTHDTFPFAGFVGGDDIAARVETGQVDHEGARRETAARHRLMAKLDVWLPRVGGAKGRAAPADVPGSGQDNGSGVAAEAPGLEGHLFPRVVTYLAQSNAAFLLFNLEDLWGETRPQNQPGTGAERGNWERKLAATDGELRTAVKRLARIIHAGRSGAPDSRSG